jgi:hypothetical protein
MKLIFLDIDGVLNGHEWDNDAGSCTIKRECVLRLNRIIRETKARIVLSSAWRYMILGEDMTCRGFEYLLRTHGACGVRIIDTTRRERMLPCPDAPPGMMLVHPGENRGDLIAEWLAAHDKPDAYVVLDDDDDRITKQHPAVITNSETGLTDADADKAIEILNAVSETLS